MFEIACEPGQTVRYCDQEAVIVFACFIVINRAREGSCSQSAEALFRRPHWYVDVPVTNRSIRFVELERPRLEAINKGQQSIIPVDPFYEYRSGRTYRV